MLYLRPVRKMNWFFIAHFFSHSALEIKILCLEIEELCNISMKKNWKRNVKSYSEPDKKQRSSALLAQISCTDWYLQKKLFISLYSLRAIFNFSIYISKSFPLKKFWLKNGLHCLPTCLFSRCYILQLFCSWDQMEATFMSLVSFLGILIWIWLAQSFLKNSIKSLTFNFGNHHLRNNGVSEITFQKTKMKVSFDSLYNNITQYN